MRMTDIQSTGLLRPCRRYGMVSYSTTLEINVYYHKYWYFMAFKCFHFV